MDKYFCLLTGSLIGGLARYELGSLVQRRWGAGFPWGTLMVNVTGCFIIGILNSLAEEKFYLSNHARLLLMTGFCGAYTTFSTLILETSDLFKSGEWTRAFTYAGGSFLMGFLCFRLGSLLGEVI